MNGRTIVRITLHEAEPVPGTSKPFSILDPVRHGFQATEDAVGLVLLAESGHSSRIPWGNVRSVHYAAPPPKAKAVA